MNTEDIHIFLTICRCKNISKAANELFTSQSSISYKLSILETELNAKLFRRQKGQTKLSLTDAGESFFPIAQKMNDLYAEALRVGEKKARTNLLVAGVDSVNCYFLSNFYPKFAQNNLDIELKVINQFTNNILNKVEDNLYDIGISNDYYNLGSIHSYPLFKESFVCLKKCLPDEKTEEISTISISDLDPTAEIFQGFSPLFIQWRKNRSPIFCPKFSTENVNIGIKFMNFPGDWMIMPYTAAKYYYTNDSFQIYKLDSPPSPRVVYITTNIKKTPHKREAIMTFLNALDSYTKENCTNPLISKLGSGPTT